MGLLLKEVKKAQAVVMKIKEMRQGLLGTALVTVHNEVRTPVMVHNEVHTLVTVHNEVRTLVTVHNKVHTLVTVHNKVRNST